MIYVQQDSLLFQILYVSFFEKEKRKLIYSIGGLFNFEGNSVSVFEDLVEEHSFFKGPRYFSEMIKSSK